MKKTNNKKDAILNEANAKIIAAAPELLNALSLATQRLNQLIDISDISLEQRLILNNEIGLFQEAINKATL